MTSQSLRRLHSLSGLFPLAAYLVFHAWEHWPIRDGRDAALARLRLTASTPLEILLVIAPLLIHAALGIKLAREPDDSRAYASPAFRQFQAITGYITAAFLLWHVIWVWGARVGDAQGVVRSYDAMLTQAGSTLGASLHVVALSAVCVHFGQGLSAAWLRFRPQASEQRARSLGILLGVLLWLVLVDELSAYAGGAPLL
jgi:succinate dehydrogenase/fumarate reductase cytochrome b subunit